MSRFRLITFGIALGSSSLLACSDEPVGLPQRYGPRAFSTLASGWETKAPLPTGRTAAGGGVIGDKLYVAGGYVITESGDYKTNELTAYDPLSDRWTSLARSQTAWCVPSSGAIGGKLYVVGGWINCDSNSPTSMLEIYDPLTNTWSVGSPAPIARGTSAYAVLDGKLFIAGGRGRCCTVNTELEIYDPATNSWNNPGAPLPLPVEGAAGAASNGKFYVIGGYDRSAQGITNAVQIYDPNTNSWTISSAPMPTARNFLGPSAAVMNGHVYAIGGLVVSPTNVNESYDPLSGTWLTNTAMPTPRYGAVTGVIAGRVYVAGGFNTTTLNVLEVYSPFVSDSPPAPEDPVNKDQCKDAGWKAFGFRNQGQCIAFVLTGHDSR